MVKHKVVENVSSSKVRRSKRVVEKPPVGEVTPVQVSDAINQAIKQLKGISIENRSEVWSSVINVVLDVLDLPEAQRDETRDFLEVLIETDPRLQETIEAGLREQAE